MGVDVLLFIFVGLLAVGFAVGMLITDNAVHSALFLIANLGCVAFMYLMLDAPFIAMVQIAVYAGAIMVLFLFVIMLLGADITTDVTTRKFRWLSWAAMSLGVILVLALALPLLGGFRLPGTEGNAPMVRVVHASVAPTVNIEITGGNLTEPLRLEAVAFGEVSDWQTLAAGDYTVIITNAETGIPVAQPQSVTLTADQVVTLVAGSELNLEASKLVQLFVVENSLAPVGDDAGRLVIYNGYSAEPLTLIDLGPDEVISTTTRSGETVLLDPVIAENILYEGAPATGTYHEGTYTLALVRTLISKDEETQAEKITGYEMVHTLPDYTIAADTEATLLLVKDGAQPADSSLLATIRSTVIPGLVTDTQPAFGSPLGVGRILFTVYLLPVNLVGLLLLAALVGVIVISRPSGEKQERRANIRRRVSRPLVNVIAQQTGGDVVVDTPKLGPGDES